MKCTSDGRKHVRQTVGKFLISLQLFENEQILTKHHVVNAVANLVNQVYRLVTHTLLIDAM
jgi:hypothetical protein